MRIFGKAALASAFCVIASPAFACDMHGGGMFWTPSSHWQNFSPTASSVDPAFLSGEESDYFEEGSSTFEPALQPRKARPSFSSAANKASRAAKTRLMMMEKRETDESVVTAPSSKVSEEEPIIKTGLKTNTQTVR